MGSSGDYLFVKVHTEKTFSICSHLYEIVLDLLIFKDGGKNLNY